MIHGINASDGRMIARDLNAIRACGRARSRAEDVGVGEDEMGDGFGIVGDDEAVGLVLNENC